MSIQNLGSWVNFDAPSAAIEMLDMRKKIFRRGIYHLDAPFRAIETLGMCQNIILSPFACSYNCWFNDDTITLMIVINSVKPAY